LLDKIKEAMKNCAFIVLLLFLSNNVLSQVFNEHYYIDTFESSIPLLKQPANPIKLNNNTWVFVKFRGKRKLRLYYAKETNYYDFDRIEISLIQDYRILKSPKKVKGLTEDEVSGRVKNTTQYRYKTKRIKSCKSDKFFSRKFFYLKSREFYKKQNIENEEF